MEDSDQMDDRDDKGDSSSSESESEVLQQVEELQEAIEASPYHYDSHVQLIQLLRQLGDLDKARQARRQMSKIFPLSEELWLQWIGDELPLCSIPEAAMEMKELFETAVKDYLSVPIWLQYAQFAIERMSLMPEGMAFPRDVFEKAIVSCGLHVAQAGLLWDAYLEFELAVMTSLQTMKMVMFSSFNFIWNLSSDVSARCCRKQMQQNDPKDEDMKKQVEEQYERLEKIYKRKCAVPHLGLDSIPDGLKEVLDITDQSTPPTFQRTKRKLEEYLPFEKQLETTSPPSLEAYYAYLSHLSSNKDNPSLINTLYQRTIAHHCLDLDLWKQYIKFLESNFKRAAPVLLPCYEQAVRNCPWVVDFWVGYARALERNSADCEEVHSLFDRALEGNLTEGKDYLELWTTYCDYMRRRINFEADSVEDMEEKMAELRKLFARARSHLSKYYGNSGDPTDSLSHYQIAMETQCYQQYTPPGDSELSQHHYTESKKLWKDVMTRHGRQAKYWLEYTNMERALGHYEECRKVFQMAINSASDEPESVCDAMLQFEREQGTLDSFEMAMEKCAAQLKRVRERREMAAEKEAQKKEEAKRQKKQEKAKQKKGKGGGSTAESGDSVRPPQRQPAGGKRSKASSRQQSSHVFYESGSDEEGAEPVAKKLRVVDDEKEGPPVGSSINDVPVPMELPQRKAADAESADSADQPSAMKSSSSAVAMETESPSEKPQLIGSKEQRTVFVSNLSMAITEERLREKFVECGPIAEIRLIKTRHASKRTNSYAYVEFTSPDPVESALAMDRSELDGRPLYVSRFREKGTVEKPTSARHSDNRCTVFVTNIQHHFTDKDLEELFKQCGPLKEVRLVKNRAGISKGFAYIEYLNESSAKEAVMKLDQYQLGVKRVKVAISNPPKRPSASAGQGDEGEIPTARDTSDGFKKPSFIPYQAKRIQSHPASEQDPFTRRSKTNISLVPRAVARKSESVPGNQQESSSESGSSDGKGTVTKMSNDDFRKLIFKADN